MCYKGMFGLVVASGLSDYSKWFTLYTLAYLFIPKQFRLLLEAFSHIAITVQRRYTRKTCVLPHSVSWYVVSRLLYSSAWLFFCQISSGELSIASAEGNARVVVACEKRIHLMMSATYMCLRDSMKLLFLRKTSMICNSDAKMHA